MCSLLYADELYRIVSYRIATTPWGEARERRLGEYLVLGDVRRDGARGRPALLQARHEVRPPDALLNSMLMLTWCPVICSIQTWALQEAKARMEARGEKTEYP